ncbi:mucin-4 isoform X2 [Gallus gallus]|uniref:mucin-4 isoform X2 n=1 Tax=Gallus gallus TaxID=9031 RepID=UPI001AE4DA47|nr:mucin-4 isoform X2 [Gallus gallus]
MGTRGWMLPTLMGCCLWILHGLGTAAAVPVTTEGPFAATPSQGEAPTALLLGTVGTSTVNDTVMAESILVSPTMSPSSPSWAEPDSVTETTGYNSPLGAERDAELSAGEVTQAPTGDPQAGTDVATSLDETQKYQSGSAAAKAAAIAVTPQPNFTPSTKHNVTGTAAAAPLGSTPAFADVPASTTRAGAGLESTADATFLLSATIPTAAGTQAMTTTPLRPGLTALPPDAGAEVEDVPLPGDGQGDGSAPSAMPSPGARGLLPTPSGEVVSGTVGDTPGWAALKSGDVGDAAHGVFSTADLPQLPPENVTALGAAENPGQNSLLTSQAGLSPANLLGPGDGDRQGDPAVLPSSPGSALAQSEAPTAPGVRGDTATLLPAIDVQSDADVPAPDTGVPLPTGAVDVAEGSLQPALWLSPIGEEQPLLGADPPVPTDTSGAPSTAFPPPGVAAGSLPATDDGTEAVVSPDFSADLGVSLSSPLEGSQPWGTAADGASTSLNSALGATNPSSSGPDGTALPAAGQQAQGDTGAGDTTQAEDAGDGSPYENTQSDTSSAASSTQQGPADSAPGAVLYTNLSPAADPGEGALAPALSPDGPAAPSQDLSGAGGAEPLPIETPGAPGAALPPPAAVDGTVFGPDDGAEAAVSPDLSAAPEAPVSPSLGASQPWDAAAGAPQDTALPGAEGPGTGINSVLDAPSPAVYGPVGPPSPSFGVQPGTGMGMPGVDGPDTSLSSALGATNPSLSPPDGAAFPAAGQQAQGDTGAGDTTQAEDAGDGSPYENTQSDTSSATSSTQQGPADSAPGAVLYTNLSPAADPGEGALAPALSPDGPAAPSQDLSGAGGAEPLPIETPGAPGAALPPPAAVDGTVFAADNGAEAAVSPDLSAAPEAPVSPSLGASQPWDTAAGAPQDTALPGAEGPGTGINSVLDAPSPAVYGPVGPPSPSFGVQPGAGVGMPGVDGPDTSLSSALGATNPSSFAPDGAALPPPVAVDGAVFEANNGAEAAVSPDLSAAPEAPVAPSLGVLQPWDTAAGAPQDTALPGAEGPGSGFSSALNAPSSASYGPIGPPSPDLAEQPGTGLTVLGAEGQEPGGLSSAAAFEPSLSSSPGTGLALGTGLLPGAGSPSNSASQSDALAVPSISDSDGGAAPIPAAAPGSVIPSQVSPYGEGGPELTVAQGISSEGGVAQAEIPESQSPYTDTSSAASSTQQGPADSAPGAVLHTELSPAAAPGDEALAPALSPDGPAAPSHDLSGAGGAEPLPIETLGTSGAALPLPAAVDGTVFAANNGAEAAVSPDLSAAPEAPVAPSLGASQPWDTAAGAPQDTALPGAEGPGSGFSSALNAPSLASYGPIGPPSPDLAEQPGTGLTVLGAEGQEPGGLSSAAAFEPSLSSSPDTGLKAGMDLLPGALSPSGPASPSDVLTAPSASDTAGPSGLGGAGGAPGALQPSLGAAPGLRPSAGVRDGPEAVSADGEAPGQSQDQAGTGAAAASDGRPGATLHSISSSPLADGSSSPEAAAGADTGAGIPRAGEVGSSSGLGAAAFQGNKETPILLPSIQSSASVSPPGAKLSQANVVELVGGKLGISAQEAPTASGGNGLGTVTQIASGVLPPSIPTSPRETQPLVPVAPAASIPLLVSETASARGVGDSSVPNTGPSSASSTQSGSNPPVLPWSPVDEMASGMLASLGEELQRAPNAAPAPPSASERENLKEGAAASPQISSPVPAIPAVPLYGYGPRENDHEYVQRRADFNSPLFKPETGFPFGKTLRDSLYFTDNGQIIFPASDSSIFTLPNPPAHRFTGHEGVAMIAVFWDNADFSRGTGTTFYQEFLTLNSEKPPFVRDVEEKVRRYLRSSYSAAWTLKITWEKAPAYGARGDSRRTNTYQAVLTTDGFRSYVLILYQDGGMQWDYTQLPATNVLIGYTSGDGYYRNDDLTQSPPAAKYRPDRYRGYNTDLRGLWLYKLESRVGTNYRLKCLAWTGRQQEPQAWSQDLPACPCSLQQGQQDPRFRSSRGGWGSARVSMLHSSSPNSHGAGVRCLYDGRGQLVEGRQERYWRASRQASPYRDQELKLYDWCCNQAGSAHLCAHYNEKRPRIGCDGYRAPGAEDSSEDSNSEEQRDDDEE